MHQGTKVNETIWKDFGKGNNFTMVSTEMVMHRKGQKGKGQKSKSAKL